MRRILFSSALLALAVTAGCASQEYATPPYPPVPPPMADPQPPPPVSAVPPIWQPGHWDWNGSGYVWVAGVYVPDVGHGNLWQPGWWMQTPSGWSWQPAHWAS